jgi:sRNA-binding regulator protein Hfq
MIEETAIPAPRETTLADPAPRPSLRRNRFDASAAPFRFTNYAIAEEENQHQAELFYLQKQIQTQTPMVIVLEDGEHVEGYIEWYDRNSLKVRGRHKVLVYKSAIKYMYKQGETGI